MIFFEDACKYYKDDSRALSNLTLQMPTVETLALLRSTGSEKIIIVKLISQLVGASHGKDECKQPFFDLKKASEPLPVLFDSLQDKIATWIVPCQSCKI